MVIEKLEALQTAIFQAKEAMDALQGIGEYEPWFDAFQDLAGEMSNELPDLRVEAEAEADAEEDALEREYYRSVM